MRPPAHGVRVFALSLFLAVGCWSQPAPQPTPTTLEAPPPVTARRRFLVAYQETLKFPETTELALPATALDGVCKWQKKGKVWLVTGLAPGLLSFDWGKTHWDVLVQERALKAPDQAQLTVFGGYPQAQALLHWARDFLHPCAELQELGTGLLAKGTDLIAYEGAPKKIEVVDQPLVARKADGLILSNWPEKIDHDQVLLEAPLPADGFWRVMVHHRNLPGQPLRWLEVEIVQPESSGQRYAISSFVAGPSGDEIFAGHLAAFRYFRDLSGDNPSGYITTVGPGQSHLIERVWLKPGQTVSAMLGIRVLQAGSSPGMLRVSARTPDNREALSMQPMDSAARTARGVFAGEILRQLTYKVGPTYLFEDVGGQPYLPELQKGYPSPGNFGAVYRYRWLLDNSTDQDQEVRMEMSARGGPARACLWLDGDRIETDLLKAEPRILKRWLVPAQSQLPVGMETFPQAGSNFPLSVTLSSRPSNGTLSPAQPAPLNWYIP